MPAANVFAAEAAETEEATTEATEETADEAADETAEEADAETETEEDADAADAPHARSRWSDGAGRKGNVGSQQARIAGTNPELREIPHGHGSVCRFRRKSGQSTESTGGVYRTACDRRSSVHL